MIRSSNPPESPGCQATGSVTPHQIAINLALAARKRGGQLFFVDESRHVFISQCARLAFTERLMNCSGVA